MNAIFLLVLTDHESFVDELFIYLVLDNSGSLEKYISGKN